MLTPGGDSRPLESRLTFSKEERDLIREVEGFSPRKARLLTLQFQRNKFRKGGDTASKSASAGTQG